MTLYLVISAIYSDTNSILGGIGQTVGNTASGITNTVYVPSTLRILALRFRDLLTKCTLTQR